MANITLDDFSFPEEPDVRQSVPTVGEPIPVEPEVSDTPNPLNLTRGEALMAGAGQRFVDMGKGLEDLWFRAREALASGDKDAMAKIKQEYDAFKASEEERKNLDAKYLNRAPGSGAGRLLTDVAVGTAMPVLRGAGMLSTAVKTALPYAGLEAATTEGDLGDRLTAGLAGGAGAAAGAGAVQLAGKGINAVRRKWEDPVLKELYDWARSKGVDLTVGDLNPASRFRAMENVGEHAPVLSHRSGEVDKQAGQLYEALFGQGNKIVQGIKAADKELANRSKQLWEPIYQIPAKTGVRPVDIAAEMRNLYSKYGDKIFNQIENLPLRGKLYGLATTPQSKLGSISFREYRDLQQALGRVVGDFKEAAINGNLSKEMAGDVSKAYAGMAKDLRRWGQHGGNMKQYDAYVAANETFKRDFLPWEKNLVVRRALRGDYENGGEEALLRDVLAPINRSKVGSAHGTPRSLKAYLAELDPESKNYVELLQMADRAANRLRTKGSEPNLSIFDTALALHAPLIEAGRVGPAALTTHPLLKELYQADRNLFTPTGNSPLAMAARLAGRGMVGAAEPSGAVVGGGALSALDSLTSGQPENPRNPSFEGQ